MENSEMILSGPKYEGTELLGSLAEHIIPKMKSHPKDFIIQTGRRNGRMQLSQLVLDVLQKVDCLNKESITSHEFLRKSIEVAEGLVEFGLKTGDVVALFSSSNISAQITAVGIILSGGVFAPIDQCLKTVELQHLFKQFQPKYIICETVKAKDIQKSALSVNVDAKIILIDSPNPDGEFAGWNNIRTNVDVETYIPRKVADPKKDIAIICCSSGSTGMPKGIALSHFSVLFNLSVTESLHMPLAIQSFLYTSPLYWISGTMLTITSCYFGQPRYVPKSADPEDIFETIQNCKPFFMVSSPAILYALADHPDFKKYDLSSLKTIISAGAILGETIASKIKKVWRDVTVINIYGLTETCGGIMLSTDIESTNAVGSLLPDVKVKVADLVTGEPLGPNKTGELRVKSRNLMNGYYNNDKDTKAAFDDQGWFRTGDLVYYNEEGTFYVTGRIKEIIAYRCHEISPVEIESFIISLPGVKDVAVVPVPHKIDSNHLRALVVKDPNSEINAQDIIDSVKENFSQIKQLRAGVQFVDALPRTGVGKLRRLEAQKMINFETN